MKGTTYSLVYRGFFIGVNMSFLTKITEFVGGSLFSEIKDGVMSYFPPDMSPKQKAEAELKIQQLLHQKQLDVSSILNESAKQLDARIKEQEGTASDLKQLPLIGSLVLFLRGTQRPIWGFFTMYLDYVWFTTSPGYTEQQQTALIVVNMLVLGFLFGERAIKNLEPLIMEVFRKNK
jgi:hypothetical protein